MKESGTCEKVIFEMEEKGKRAEGDLSFAENISFTLRKNYWAFGKDRGLGAIQKKFLHITLCCFYNVFIDIPIVFNFILQKSLIF